MKDYKYDLTSAGRMPSSLLTLSTNEWILKERRFREISKDEALRIMDRNSIDRDTKDYSNQQRYRYALRQRMELYSAFLIAEFILVFQLVYLVLVLLKI